MVIFMDFFLSISGAPVFFIFINGAPEFFIFINGLQLYNISGKLFFILIKCNITTSTQYNFLMAPYLSLKIMFYVQCTSYQTTLSLG